MRLISMLFLAVATVGYVCPSLAQQEQDSTQQPSAVALPAPIKHFNLKDYARVGGSVSAPDAISAPAPASPTGANSKPKKKELTTIVLVGINAQGTVEFAKVVRSSDPDWDKCAVDAVYQWRFKPAMQHGHPIASQVDIEVNFRPR
jgi:TonB family protein